MIVIMDYNKKALFYSKMQIINLEGMIEIGKSSCGN